MIREPYDAIVYYATALSHAALPENLVHIHGLVYADKTGKHADGEHVSLICDPRSALVGHWMGRPVYKTTTGIKILFNENPPAMKDETPMEKWNGHDAGPDEVIRKAQGKIYVHLKLGYLYRVAGYGFDSERERWMLRYVRCNADNEISFFHLPEDFFREGRFLEIKE